MISSRWSTQLTASLLVFLRQFLLKDKTPYRCYNMNVNFTNLDSNFEQWASIDGYLNYQVSWWGRVSNTKTGRILKPGTSSGYLCVNLSKDGQVKRHPIHNLVAREWAPNPEGKRCVDHMDNDKTNNHHKNLRYATHTENGRNRKKQLNATSAYKGVSIHRKANKWQAQICINGKDKHLGYFASEREAAEVYNAAAREFYKEFAKLNIFDD